MALSKILLLCLGLLIGVLNCRSQPLADDINSQEQFNVGLKTSKSGRTRLTRGLEDEFGKQAFPGETILQRPELKQHVRKLHRAMQSLCDESGDKIMEFLPIYNRIKANPNVPTADKTELRQFMYTQARHFYENHALTARASQLAVAGTGEKVGDAIAEAVPNALERAVENAAGHEVERLAEGAIEDAVVAEGEDMVAAAAEALL